MEGKVCIKCGKWKPLDEFHDRKDRENKKRSDCKECVRERCRQYRKNNVEKIRERESQYRKNNKEHVDLVKKQWRENNKEKVKECRKQYREKNKEKLKEEYKQYYQNSKENNLQYISSVVEQINPAFKQLNLPIYGYIYKFENAKTGRVYIGQTTQSLKGRYGSDIIKSWVKERMKYENQKFKEELIEEDIEVTEVLDVACCQYHLNILEADYIEKYDSYNNGYNNNAGHYKDDTGTEEFEQILKEYGIIIERNEIIKINRKQKTEHFN